MNKDFTRSPSPSAKSYKCNDPIPAPKASTIKELSRASYLAYQLRSERKRMIKASKAQTKLNQKLTKMRRDAEDRAVARELSCEVSDFAY